MPHPSWLDISEVSACLLQTTIQAASATGVLMVCSAGNEGVNTDTVNHYPSSFTSDIVLAVGATDNTDALWTRSNYGAKTVQVAAPGVSVLGLGLGGTYITLTGTSMSTPHVTGTAALMLQRSASLHSGHLPTGFRPPLPGRKLCRAGVRAEQSSALLPIEPPA